jgi:hypothetical protein
MYTLTVNPFPRNILGAPMSWAIGRSNKSNSSKQYTQIQLVPQREHNASALTYQKFVV